MVSKQSGTRPDPHQLTAAAATVTDLHPQSRPRRGIAAAFRRIQNFVAGLMIGMSAWTPVFVATAAEETRWEQYGLPGGIALFTAGLWLRVGNFIRRARDVNPPDPGSPTSGIGGFARN